MTLTSQRLLTVAYDIARLSAGGTNGGIKVHHYEFLRRFVEKHSQEIRLFVFCREEIVPELCFLGLDGLHQIHVLGPRRAYEPRSSNGTLPSLRYWPDLPENLLALLRVDALYAGFGFSELYTPEVPQVSLIVDVLHRGYPETLPPAEVQFRDRWYAEAVERSVLIQTNSEYCKDELVKEFGTNPETVFSIGLPLHGRFNRVEMGNLPSQIAHLPHRYFLYPANYWSHKNHERLIEAYSIYKAKAGDQALHLVLTGQIDERGIRIARIISEIGLEDYIHPIGHTTLTDYKAVWELAHSLVFPSLYEGFGLPLLEAHFFQKPVLRSNGYDSHLLAPQALAVDATNVPEIADGLAKLQANPHHYRDDGATLSSFDNSDESSILLGYLGKAANRRRKADATNA
ncbi:glycosyltransferase [Pelagicoccus sp. SDUM812002]|uniref:glycosyltransferase n=1 Tax=Pelagicoccus sp. SDUM812002 TaxID=3041266 RepID=UPI00280EAB81|nr:glycosyltransferase [Pelagicoccus sp. SDUM812002]MDQ8184705.1 glycosyltransferase [Pelagicoccus sp. SDUM812002]